MGTLRAWRAVWAALVALLLGVAALSGAETRQPAPDLIEKQLLKLLSIRTVYVAELTSRGGRGPLRDMLISSLQRRGLFVLTEDETNADAVLKGSGEDLVFSDYDHSRNGLNARGAFSSSRREGGESDYGSASFGVGETDASTRRERKHEAAAAVRLVLADGEIVWSTTQESQGAKFLGSSADVAEKVAKHLAAAFERAKKLAQQGHTNTQGAP